MSRKMGKKLGIESLESRSVMAGNVFANVVGGNLVLAGDSANNAVMITSVRPNYVRVSAMDAGTLTPTLVNGGVAREFYVPGGNVTANMGAGADRVLAQGLRVKNLTIDGGAGADSVQVATSVIDSTLKVTAGADLQLDADRVVVNNVNSAAVLIKTGGGNDDVRLYDNAMGLLLVDGGNGWDTMRVRGNKPLAWVPTISGIETTLTS